VLFAMPVMNYYPSAAHILVEDKVRYI
jgi:hypothetical protein